MGAQQSKDELLYRQVDHGNVECSKALRSAGAGLEWIDKEGKTPLILACMRPELLLVVKVLIDLGANVNEYRPGSHAGTPLHHAVKKGLVQTVELLLAHGANPLAMNDDCKTALDLARTDNHWNIVRLIESRICLFAGWLQEVQGPSIFEAIVRQWVSRKMMPYHTPLFHFGKFNLRNHYSISLILLWSLLTRQQKNSICSSLRIQVTSNNCTCYTMHAEEYLSTAVCQMHHRLTCMLLHHQHVHLTLSQKTWSQPWPLIPPSSGL